MRRTTISVFTLALHSAVAFMVPAISPALRPHALRMVDLPDAPGDVDYAAEAVVADEMEAMPADVEEAVAAAVPTGDDGASKERQLRLKSDLLAVAAGCTRGESATADDTSLAADLISQLEEVNPSPEPTLSPDCTGTWELVYSDTQLFRSSPFFMAGRAVCADGDEAKRYDWFCDMHRLALAISTIGKVRQIVSRESIVSEFEVKVGAVPFLSDAAPFLSYSGGLPFTVTGSIVSTASIEGNLGTGWRLLMDTVEIKGSNLPLLRQALDAGLKLQSRELGRTLEDVVPSYANPRPLFSTTYLDDTLRISRDQDGKAFVYVKQSAATQPTDYADVPADLGVGALLSGMTSSLF